MSEEPDTPPFSTVDINNDNRDDEDLFASAVQVSYWNPVLITCCVRVRPPAAWRQIVNAPDNDIDMKEMRNDYNYYVTDYTFIKAVNYSMLITVGKKYVFRVRGFANFY